jgi:L-fuconolactonase
MFEGNFPVDKGSCGHAALWNPLKRITSDCSAEEKTRLVAGTATNFYRLG